MSNYIEYKDTLAFHPGYYIDEIIEESGLTQADFAKRLDTTAKNLSLLVRGRQSLSVDMAMKLSRMLGTSIQYWLNLQNSYDAVLARIKSDEELEREKNVLRLIGYDYFRDCFGLPDLPRMFDEQVAQVRTFLRVASLSVLLNRSMAASFRDLGEMGEELVAKANTMTQIAINEASKMKGPSYDRHKFERAIDAALMHSRDCEDFYPRVRRELLDAGVVLVVLPNLKGSKVCSANKRVGRSIMMMVNETQLYVDSFWVALLREAGNALNGDFGVSFEGEVGGSADAVRDFVENKLIDPLSYEAFLQGRRGQLTEASIGEFAAAINRDPAIVLGRLERDGYVSDGSELVSLRHKYCVSLDYCESMNQ